MMQSPRFANEPIIKAESAIPEPSLLPNSHDFLKPLDRRSYPEVNYWHRIDWNNRSSMTTITDIYSTTGIKGKKRHAAGINVNYSFIEDEDGIPVDGYQISGITNQL